MNSDRHFLNKLEEDLALVRGDKASIENMSAIIEEYVRWHRENPTLAKPRVMFLHQEALREGE